MLSDSPPERDVIWTEAGVEGAHATCSASGALITRLARRAAPAWAAASGEFGDAALDLRREVHRTIDAVNATSSGSGSTRAVRSFISYKCADRGS
jgi:leucyl-tRNA synthetase